MIKKQHLRGFGAALVLLLFAAPGDLRSQGEQRGEELARVKEVLEKSVQSDPRNSELWSQLGFANQKLEDTDSAQRAFEKAVEFNPQHGDALYMLGLIYEKKNMKPQALKAWKAFLEVSTHQWKRSVAEKHIHNLNYNE